MSWLVNIKHYTVWRIYLNGHVVHNICAHTTVLFLLQGHVDLQDETVKWDNLRPTEMMLDFSQEPFVDNKLLQERTTRKNFAMMKIGAIYTLDLQYPSPVKYCLKVLYKPTWTGNGLHQRNLRLFYYQDWKLNQIYNPTYLEICHFAKGIWLNMWWRNIKETLKNMPVVCFFILFYFFCSI